jgi:hypothetical protein
VQARDLLTPFGAIKAFNLIKEKNSPTSTVVFEYEDPACTPNAITGLNALPIADMKLEVQRVPATVAQTLLQPTRSNMNIKAPPTDVPDQEPTRVLRLANMVTSDELKVRCVSFWWLHIMVVSFNRMMSLWEKSGRMWRMSVASVVR